MFPKHPGRTCAIFVPFSLPTAAVAIMTNLFCRALRGMLMIKERARGTERLSLGPACSPPHRLRSTLVSLSFLLGFGFRLSSLLNCRLVLRFRFFFGFQLYTLLRVTRSFQWPTISISQTAVSPSLQPFPMPPHAISSAMRLSASACKA